jgi:DNA-binding NarL/FixJ family response regulator
LTKNIFIADSSELVRRGLKAILKPLSSGFNLTEVVNSSDLTAQLKLVPNSILIIDYTSSGFSLDDVVKIKSKFKNLLIVAITPYINANTIVQAVRAGIESHIKKECSANEIIESINETIKGNKFYCSDIVSQMRNESVDINKIKFNTLSYEDANLTERELQIIQFIAEGYTNSQIAAVLYLSNHTVNTHRKNIMKKLNVNNTAGIVMYAVKTQLVSPNQFSFNSQS